MLAILTSNRGLAGIAIALVLGIIAVQTGRLAHAKADQIDQATHKPWKAEAQAAATALSTCQANVATLTAANAAQNAAVEADKAAGDRRAQMLSDALQGARAGALAASKRSAAILAHKAVGADECAKLMDVDRAIVGVAP